MAVTPTGPISEPLVQLRTMLSESTAFQQRVGAANAAAALEKIKLSLFRANLDGTGLDGERPFAVISLPTDPTYDAIAGGSKVHFAHTGVMEIYLTDVGRYPASLDDESIDFGNYLGALLQYFDDESGVDDNLALGTLSFPTIYASDLRDGRAFRVWEAVLRVRYGDQ